MDCKQKDLIIINILMAILITIRNILVILKLFYWYAFTASIRSLRRKTLKHSHQYWAGYCCDYMQVILEKLENSQEMTNGKAMILTNHRTQADFFIHSVITEHKSNFLSRMIVGIIFFIFGISSSESLWLFNRSKKIEPQVFNQWLDRKFRQSSKPYILAYPEGHRMGASTSVDPTKLKTGMIKYAFRRKIPIQFLMSFGNEKVFNEKKLIFNWGVKVYYSFSKFYNPTDFANENEFAGVIKQEFTKYFDDIYKIYAEKQGIHND